MILKEHLLLLTYSDKYIQSTLFLKNEPNLLDILVKKNNIKISFLSII